MASQLYKNVTLILKLALAGFILLFILALWGFRDNLFRTLLDPRIPFQTYTPPEGADYRTAHGWLNLPDLERDSELYEGKADIFVVTPTIFLGRSDWVAPIADAEFRRDSERIILPNYVLPYRDAGRVFAPYYRQAALYSFMTSRYDSRLARHFAYDDVRRAFEQFLAHSKPERPIILVGHGQGGLHIQQILQDFFDPDRGGPEQSHAARKRAEQLAAAYIIDHPTPHAILPDSTPPCAEAASFNCVVSFGAFTPKDGKIARYYLNNTQSFDEGELVGVAGRELLCVNPLSWSQDTSYIDSSQHLGGVAAEGLGREQSPAPAPRQFGAQCQDGLLLIDEPKQRSLRRPKRFGGKFKTLHANLFYEDLRQNMKARITALIAADILPRRAPIIADETLETVEDVLVTLPEEP